MWGFTRIRVHVFLVLVVEPSRLKGLCSVHVILVAQPSKNIYLVKNDGQ